MKTQEYIKSGILEAYLLGVISEDEQHEVQQMATAYPEISETLLNLEAEIEVLCLESAVPPPATTWNQIQARIGRTEIQKRSNLHQNYSQEQTTQEPPKPDYLDVEFSDTHLRVHKYWRPAFIAVFVLGKIFLACALYYYFKSNSLEQEIQRLKTEVQETRSR